MMWLTNAFYDQNDQLNSRKFAERTSNDDDSSSGRDHSQANATVEENY